MPPDSPLAGLAHAIQLAVAPVFLLSGIAGLLGVLTNRLARVIDRSRMLEMMQGGLMIDPTATERGTAELRVLRVRVRHINRAITLCTYSALLIAAVVAVLFVGAVGDADLTLVVSGAFVLAMLALIAGLSSFLREIHVATKHYREDARQVAATTGTARNP
jgi:predicted lysophospholipase L1 biosynthesis ABC-type transport system permease subunit